MRSATVYKPLVDREGLVFFLLYLQAGKAHGDSMRLTTQVSGLKPSSLQVFDDPTHDNLNIGEDAHEAPQSLRACSVGDEDDLIFPHTMVKQDLDGHQSSAATAHLRVKKQNPIVLANLRRQRIVVQLRLACAEVGLDENAAGTAVGDDSLEAGLEDTATTKDNYGGHDAIQGEPVVGVAWDWRFHDS